MTNYSRKILITGSDGQIGNALRAHADAKKFQVIACNRNQMDITEMSAIEKAIAAFSPDMIINTAAYTAVDKAESESELAHLINHQGAKNLAIACNKNKIPLIHLSTDYIFDGEKSSPYLESDNANPINVYGESKWLGEEAIREYCDQHIILRVSGVFSEYGNNFYKTMLRLVNEKKELKIVSDQITCPTYAGNIAGVIYSMIADLKKYGTWHYCDFPAVSWHQFATEITSDEKIKKISTEEYKSAAKRPAYSVLDCNKLKNDFGIIQNEWREALGKLS